VVGEQVQHQLLASLRVDAEEPHWYCAGATSENRPIAPSGCSRARLDAQLPTRGDGHVMKRDLLRYCQVVRDERWLAAALVLGMQSWRPASPRRPIPARGRTRMRRRTQ
jgi:hypothetical protein